MSSKMTYSAIVTVLYVTVYFTAIIITSIISAIEVRRDRKMQENVCDQRSRIHDENNETDEISPHDDAETEPMVTSFAECDKALIEVTHDITEETENTKAQSQMTYTSISQKPPLNTDHLHTTDASCTDNCLDVTKLWLASFGTKLQIYLSLIPHIFDQATDFGVLIEYYTLYKSGEYIGGTNPFWFFFCGLIILLLHRIMTSMIVCNVTRNLSDMFLQLFDLLMMKAVIVAHRVDSTEPTTMQRYLYLLEATFESAPQILLSIVFILKSTDAFAEVSPIVRISLIFSIFTLCNRVIWDDEMMVRQSWKSLEFHYDECPMVNWRYLLRAVWRCLEITNRICLWVLTWNVYGGLVLFVILLSEFVYLLILCVISKKEIYIGMMVYSVITAWRQYSYTGHDVSDKMLTAFHFYRIMFMFIYSSVMVIMATRPIGESLLSHSFGLFIFCYFWISVTLWMCLSWSMISFDNINDKAARMRDVKILASGHNFKDIVELWSFGVPLSQDEARHVVRVAFVECEDDKVWNQIFEVIQKHYQIFDLQFEGAECNGTPLIESVVRGYRKDHFIPRMEHILSQCEVDGIVCHWRYRGRYKTRSVTLMDYICKWVQIEDKLYDLLDICETNIPRFDRTRITARNVKMLARNRNFRVLLELWSQVSVQIGPADLDYIADQSEKYCDGDVLNGISELIKSQAQYDDWREKVRNRMYCSKSNVTDHIFNYLSWKIC
eukprot:985504_1